MYFEIISAEYVENYKIKLVFEDGNTGIADLVDYPDPKNIFSAFLDINFFKNFQIEYGTLVWGNGELDLAPETLYSRATGKEFNYDKWKRVGEKEYNIHDLVKRIAPEQKQSEVDWGKPEGKEIF